MRALESQRSSFELEETVSVDRERERRNNVIIAYSGTSVLLDNDDVVFHTHGQWMGERDQEWKMCYVVSVWQAELMIFLMEKMGSTR